MKNRLARNRQAPARTCDRSAAAGQLRAQGRTAGPVSQLPVSRNAAIRRRRKIDRRFRSRPLADGMILHAGKAATALSKDRCEQHSHPRPATSRSRRRPRRSFGVEAGRKRRRRPCRARACAMVPGRPADPPRSQGVAGAVRARGGARRSDLGRHRAGVHCRWCRRPFRWPQALKLLREAPEPEAANSSR